MKISKRYNIYRPRIPRLPKFPKRRRRKIPLSFIKKRRFDSGRIVDNKTIQPYKGGRKKKKLAVRRRRRR